MCPVQEHYRGEVRHHCDAHGHRDGMDRKVPRLRQDREYHRLRLLVTTGIWVKCDLDGVYPDHGTRNQDRYHV